jgi:Pyruvate/2-oxoacid:ferredoxin oxidoreductase delta subunit
MFSPYAEIAAMVVQLENETYKFLFCDGCSACADVLPYKQEHVW